MKLAEWIATVGYDRATKILDEDWRTLQSWKLGKRRPRPKTAQKIVRRTKGVVDMAGIYG
jgi:hypothetical protein